MNWIISAAFPRWAERTMMSADDYIRVKDAAELLGVTPRAIHTYREQGLIQARPVQAGKVTQYRLLRQSVLKWVQTES